MRNITVDFMRRVSIYGRVKHFYDRLEVEFGGFISVGLDYGVDDVNVG